MATLFQGTSLESGTACNGLSRSQHEEACARAVHVRLCVIARVGTSQCRHPPWLHLRFEDKLGQTHGGVIAAR
jgi:hypothetical protein